MPLRVRFLTHQAIRDHWTVIESPIENWKFYYRPPWLMVLHLLQVCGVLLVYSQVALPCIKNTFMARRTFVSHLCPDSEIFKPIDDIGDILDFVTKFADNLDSLFHDSFLQLEFVEPHKPFGYLVQWRNGTTSEFFTLDINIELFYHVEELRIYSDFYSISPKSSTPGCTKWHVAAVYTRSLGSYTFYSAPHLVYTSCNESYMASIKRLPFHELLADKRIKKMNKIKTPQTKKSKSSSTTLISEPRNNFLSQKERLTIHQLKNKYLVGAKLSQYTKLSSLMSYILVASFVCVIMLLSSIVERLHQHSKWLISDPQYKDLDLYEQIHYSLGFWHIIQFFTEVLLLCCSVFILYDSNSMTQYMSVSSLKSFAFGFFFTLASSCRWFIYTPRMYQLIRIIRVSFSRIINIFIGLSPFVASLMFLGAFLFGFVSDISKSFFRFIQLFVGVTFGDDLFNIYSYYTDASDLYTTMSFFYVTLVTMLATYICFPAFTASISFLHKTEVVPVEEREAEE